MKLIDRVTKIVLRRRTALLDSVLADALRLGSRTSLERVRAALDAAAAAGRIQRYAAGEYRIVPEVRS